MRYYLQVLGMPSAFTSSSLMLFFDSARYLFNGGEGIQRFCVDNNVKLSKVSDLFLTGVDHNVLGALTGFMLSLRDTATLERRRIHGPPGIAAYIAAACSSYLYNDHFDIIEYNNYSQTLGPISITENRVFENENVTVNILPLFFNDTQSIEISDNMRLSTPETSGMVYVIKCKKAAAKFRPDLAKGLGVPAGPLFSKLSKGETIEYEGRRIHPGQVTDPSPKQPVIAIIHIPTPQLIEDRILEMISECLSEDYDFNTIVHLSPIEVLTHPTYSVLLDMLPDYTSNLVLHPSCTWEAFRKNPLAVYHKSEEFLTQLNTFAPQFFSFHSNHTDYSNKEQEFQQLSSLFKNFVLPDYLLKIVLSPATSREIDRTAVPEPIDKERIVEKTLEMILAPPLKPHRMSYQEVVNTTVPGSDPTVLLLGTASMKPGKYRNVSGIWIGDYAGSILLDCGEGTFAQFYRHFGETAYHRLSEINGILISHLHADHHSGIVKVLYERSKLTRTPAIVMAPKGFSVFLTVCETLLGDLNYQFVPIGGEELSLGDLTISTVPVDHSIEAYGFVLAHQSGWKIVYSGDTRPSEALVQAGLNATLLIHEATFDDDLAADAVNKCHSTISEALSVGAAMNAWKVVLTHFSQRYSKIPETTEVDAIIGFDLLRFKLSESYAVIQQISALTPLFADAASN